LINYITVLTTFEGYVKPKNALLPGLHPELFPGLQGNLGELTALPQNPLLK